MVVELAFRVDLESPLTIARHRESRTPETLDYIPGTVFRGALLGVLYRRGEDENNLFGMMEQGRNRFPFLWPEGPDVFTAPLTLLECKQAGSDHPLQDVLFDRYRALADDRLEDLRTAMMCTECGNDLVPAGGYVCWNDGGCRKTESYPVSFRMHVGIDRTTGTAYPEILFGHQQLEAHFSAGPGDDQRQAAFHGSGLFREADAERLKELDGETIFIGKNRSRGQGRATVKIEEKSSNGETTIERIVQVSQKLGEMLGDGTWFTVDIASPLIAVDEWLRPATSTECWLPKEAAATPVHQEYRRMRVSGYDVSANLPREEDIAIAPGGVVLARSDRQIDEIAPILAESEKRGLGIRRSGGFGAVVFNSPLHFAGEGA